MPPLPSAPSRPRESPPRQVLSPRPGPSAPSRSLLPAGLLAALLAVLLLLQPIAPAWAATEEAVLAGGCFWCLEHDLEEIPGVLDVESGYSGGKKANPTYAEVSAGGTGHQESVRVRFDNTRIRYDKLLRTYWRNIDPFDGGGQFCDRGDSYRPVIFTTSATQAVEARNSLVAAARELGRPASAIKVSVRTLNRFWPAEGYHQNYARRNGLRYSYYRWACGRDRRLTAVWGRRAREGERWTPAASQPATASPTPATSANGGTGSQPGSAGGAPSAAVAPPAAQPATTPEAGAVAAA